MGILVGAASHQLCLHVLLPLLNICRPHLPLPQLGCAWDDLAQIADWQVQREVNGGEHES